MSPFVESLRRLYLNGLLETVRIVMIYDSGKITAEEKEYILRVEGE